MSIVLLSSCVNKENVLDDFQVINDVFPNLFIKDYSFESFLDFKNRKYSKEELEKFEVDSLYNEYEENKILKKKLNVYIYNKLFSIEKKDVEFIEEIHSYEINDLEEVKTNPREIINLPPKLFFSSFNDATLARYKFSRVCFNNNKDEAFFVLKLDCLNGCYNEHVVFVKKHGNKWVVDKKIMIATS